MKVSNQNPPASSLNETQRKNEVGTSEATQKKAGKEISKGAGSSVEISDEARLMNQASEIAHRPDPLRADRIAEIKRQVQNGTYAVKSADIADRLVEDHLLNHLGENSL